MRHKQPAWRRVLDDQYPTDFFGTHSASTSSSSSSSSFAAAPTAALLSYTQKIALQASLEASEIAATYYANAARALAAGATADLWTQAGAAMEQAAQAKREGKCAEEFNKLRDSAMKLANAAEKRREKSDGMPIL